jgi:hypothetical protein
VQTCREFVAILRAGKIPEELIPSWQDRCYLLTKQDEAADTANFPTWPFKSVARERGVTAPPEKVSVPVQSLLSC